jgi:adenosylhomocysteine nucleosidase
MTEGGQAIGPAGPVGPVGILVAMPEEGAALVEAMDLADRIEHGRREFLFGDLWGVRSIVVVARCGKVAAATTVTELIVRFGVSRVICTGVAGGVGEGVDIGDVVVADALVQHDLDPRPLWPRHVVPLLETGTFATDPDLSARIADAGRAHADEDGAGGSVHTGLIASGDEFIHGPTRAHEIRDALPGVLAVEMEGAAVAQVCYEYGVPFAVFRTISDRADTDAASDFGESLGSFAASHTRGILSRVFRGGLAGV